MKKWEIDEVDKIVELLKMGLTYFEISIEIKRTPESIRGKLFKLNLNYTHFQKKDNVCLFCGETINKKKKFCNNSCSAKFNNTKRKLNNFCLNCGKEIGIRSKFCGNTCYSEYETKIINEKIENGDTSFPERRYKEYLKLKYGEKCMKCGWNEINPTTEKIPVQLEHIDGNSDNNSLDNLKLLCPNCHSLTPTYGALNKGNGRSVRKTKRNKKRSEGVL